MEAERERRPQEPTQAGGQYVAAPRRALGSHHQPPPLRLATAGEEATLGSRVSVPAAAFVQAGAFAGGLLHL